jgi:hypothetical protein
LTVNKSPDRFAHVFLELTITMSDIFDLELESAPPTIVYVGESKILVRKGTRRARRRKFHRRSRLCAKNLAHVQDLTKDVTYGCSREKVVMWMQEIDTKIQEWSTPQWPPIALALQESDISNKTELSEGHQTVHQPQSAFFGDGSNLPEVQHSKRVDAAECCTITPVSCIEDDVIHVHKRPNDSKQLERSMHTDVRRAEAPRESDFLHLTRDPFVKGEVEHDMEGATPPESSATSTRHILEPLPGYTRPSFSAFS